MIEASEKQPRFISKLQARRVASGLVFDSATLYPSIGPW
jgi:hypothetical protein